MIRVDEASGGHMMIAKLMVPWEYVKKYPYERHRLATGGKAAIK